MKSAKKIIISYLFRFVSIQRMQIFLNQIFPERDLCSGEIINLSSAEIPILNPERVYQIISLLLKQRRYFNFWSAILTVLIFNIL